MKLESKTDGNGSGVAPLAGAWIETLPLPLLPSQERSPPSRGRGLKRDHARQSAERLCRPPRGGVD